MSQNIIDDQTGNKPLPVDLIYSASPGHDELTYKVISEALIKSPQFWSAYICHGTAMFRFS